MLLTVRCLGVFPFIYHIEKSKASSVYFQIVGGIIPWTGEGKEVAKYFYYKSGVQI
jgi:hypothetical protein